MTSRQKEWHRTHMRTAYEYANKSWDPKVKVGALIVTDEGILYPGYNGDEIGGSNKRESLGQGDSGFIHAETNAIAKFNPVIHKSCKLYVTFAPCSVCAKLIVNVRSINEVYYDKEYKADIKGIEILNRCGIKTFKMEDL